MAFEDMIESRVYIKQCKLETRHSSCCLGIWTCHTDVLCPKAGRGKACYDNVDSEKEPCKFPPASYSLFYGNKQQNEQNTVFYMTGK